MDLKGKVVVVGGVGSGLGSAIVSLVARAGATTIGVARGGASLDRLQALAQAQGWRFRPIRADLAVQSEVDAAFRATVSEFGGLDGVCVSAGRWIMGDRLLHKSSDAEWADGLRDNLEPVFRVGRAALPIMMERGAGSIVIVSAAERVRWLGNASYCAAKGGLVDLTRKLAHDYRPYGIRVNAILPGNMEHEVDPATPPDIARPLGLRDESGVGAWEVARSITYLLSDESRWVTGSLLPVDGGFSTRGKEAPSTPPGEPRR